MSTDAKLIRVGLTDTALSTLPGSSGEISIEASQNDNTIYGGIFSSSLPGIKDYTFSGNAWFRETPGFEATIKRAGTPTALTDEPMEVEDGLTYIITLESRRLLDWNTEVIVEDAGVGVDAADIEQIDYLFGRVTFVSGYTVTGPITISGAYLPTAEFGCANSVSLTQNAEAVVDSCLGEVSQNGGFNTYRAGLKTVSLEASGFYRITNDFYARLQDSERLVIEIDWDGEGSTISRGIFTVQSTSQSGDVGQNEEFSVTFNLFVPEDVLPFSWYFGEDSKATQGMQDIINAWISRQDLFFDYYPLGTDSKGYKGQVVVTDCSISTSVDGIGELTLSGTGNGELEEVV